MSCGKLKKTNGQGEHVSSRGAGLVLYGHPSDLAKLSNIRPGVYSRCCWHRFGLLSKSKRTESNPAHPHCIGGRS